MTAEQFHNPSWLARPRPVRLLTVAVVVAAIAAVVLGVLQPVSRPAGRPLSAVDGICVAAVLAAIAQLAGLRFRLGPDAVSVSWAEAAVVVGFVVAPAGWLPAATLAGTGAAWLLLAWFTGLRNVAEIVHLVASMTLGVAGAALVTSLLAGDAPIGGARLPLALVAGAATYLLITFGLVVLTLVLHRDAAPGRIATRVLYAKLPMSVGNVLVGLGVVFALVREPLWLLAFGPALWLLHRTYRFHLRAAEERRMWEAFATATARLPGASEAEVARAGLRGALDVFGARRAELEVRLGSGHRRYSQDGPGQNDTTAARSGPAITRSMAVAGHPVGELTVWLGEPSMPVPQDEAAIVAYGEALAGALHDAAAHQRIAELDARAAHDRVHDRLTGLINRSAFADQGDLLLRSVDRGQHVALLLLDVVDFREVNRTLGHRGGDEVLRLVAERLTELARPLELVARTGDDEFALLLPAMAALGEPAGRVGGSMPPALRRARELVEQLRLPMEVAGVRLAVEVTVGVVAEQPGRIEVSELLRRASLAVGRAKELGLTVGTYDSSQDASSTDHLALLAELQDAFAADDQIVLHLQPAVDLVTAAPTGVEALVRWRHPRRGQLSPGAFLPAVERSELLIPFTRRVLDLALAAAADWTANGINIPVSVNVSARSLTDPTFPAQVTEALRRHRTPASRLVLEITESVAVSEQEVVDEVLARLRSSGVQMSLDDFGTGFSSLASVTRIPVDEIKIDRSFVDEMIDKPAAGAVVRGAVELGARLGVRVVAEGIETIEQRAALIELGCPTAQGYHFCKPMPADKIVQALTQLMEDAPAPVTRLRADGAS
ncbi:diguanylate cyclase (GGDEF)-like protein [Actinoplanes lutulentus]|uniref:Diguanylate cyclase/phosphodiesterase n=1 Tax=Actinoplanes lutulentus TaxID=1287878 RepID=A0A327ZHM1_9ACTN|nr:bifunctional diguanylate cyclase/phosphodiesterase [Actinoplanes lutulentus]MBB2945575.1 diguanylate cyclase (GGDEF)-like protein [Actinoplanes lutulentus]RAK40293.1 diguanylate cyclase/phosphodiesterase [Actinoplanes lutulentus]